MNDRFIDNLDDLMDRYLYDLLDENTAFRVKRRIEEDPQWQLAYEAAVARKQALAAGVRAGATQAAATRAPSAEEVLAGARGLEDNSLRRRRIIRGVFGAAAAVAAVTVIGMWLRLAMITAPGATVRLVGQTNLIAGSSASLLAIVTDLAGRRLPGVPVQLALLDARKGRSVQLARWTTGADGSASGRVAVPSWADGPYTLTARAGGLFSASTLEVPITIARAARLFLSTDKPIYQPGQTIHIRCLALRKPQLAPDAGGAVEFSITDPSGNVIFRQGETLSDYGIASADLPTDPLIVPGKYNVKVAAGGDSSEQTVEVFHYKLPAFAVKVELDRPYYLPAQSVAGSVEVRYHFGKPAAGAKVELELTGQAPGGRQTHASSTVTADKDGKGRFQMKLPAALFGSRRTGGDAHLLLTARATDSAGQENLAYRTVVVARQDIRIAAVVENGAAGAGLAGRLFVVTSYPDGRPARTVVDVESLGQSARTDDAGVAVIAAARFPDPLRISARDSAGKTGKEAIALPEVASDALVLRTDQPMYTAGGTAQVEVIAGATGEVFIDLVKDRQTMLTKSLALAGGRGQLALDLPADVSGVLQLHAYRLDSEGEWVGRDALIVVRPAGQLKVTVAKDQETYRPGQEAKLTFKVADSDGKATPAALSLSAVDEAVYSVQQAAPGLEAVLTGLEVDILTPAIEAHDFSLPLMEASANYARAVLAAAAPAPPTKAPSRLRELQARGLLPAGFLNRWKPGEIRRELQRNPALADQLGPEIVAELVGAAGPLHSLNADNEGIAQERYEEQKEKAFDQALVVSGAGIGLLLVVLLLWATGKVLFAPAGAPGRGTASAFLKIAAIAAVLALVASLLLPTLGRAKELAHRAVLSSELGAAGKAVTVAEDITGEIALGVPPAASPLAVATAAPPAGAEEPARMRTYFPETMLWRPQVITDPSGKAELTVPLADSITTWRLSGSAVSRAGRLGTVDAAIGVFQPFFVDVDAPPTLTAGDEISVPLVLYNYTAEALEVYLSSEGADGLTVLDGDKSSILLTPEQVQRVYVRVQAERAGEASLTVNASAGKVKDAIRRPIRIVPPGLPQSVAVGGTIEDGQRDVELTVPADAVEGSVTVQLKVYPSTFSELLDGLENIFRMPHGCFEQTSSTTWPNVMALSYMQANRISQPEAAAKARHYIHLGYQRLVGFEVPGGGFDWFGRAPANVLLTAYGLMEFADMAKVHNVDPKVLSRTADWLAGKQDSGGAWRAESGCFHEPFTGGDNGELAATAYVTWAIACYDAEHKAARRGADYVAAHIGQARSTLTVALCANALLAVDPRGPAGLEAARRLAELAQTGEKEAKYWAGGAVVSRGEGAGDVTTTAVAALALMKAHQPTAQVHAALRWLAARRDPYGTWGSTTPTVMALKALLAGSGTAGRRGRPAAITVALADQAGSPLTAATIAPDQSDRVHAFRLPRIDKPGAYRLLLDGRAAAGMAYQFVVRYHSLAPAPRTAQDALKVDVQYDRTDLAVGGKAKAQATVSNNSAAPANMLVVDLGTPPGFAVLTEGLDTLLSKGQIQRYTLTARGVIVYVEKLDSGSSLRISYEIVARMLLRAVAGPTRAYTYYDPDRMAAAKPATFRVK